MSSISGELDYAIGPFWECKIWLFPDSCLKSTRFAGNADGVDTVARPGLGDGAGKVVAHRALAQAQEARDLLGARSPRGRAQGVGLPCRERAPGAEGQARVDYLIARRESPHGVG